MPQEVTVHVNRASANSLETPVEHFETRDSFNLVVESHGPPAHVHCRLEGGLAQIAVLETSNYYVESDSETIIPIRVDADAIEDPIEGVLEVQTGYGSESVSIPIVVKPAPGDVDVDESLSKPPKTEPEPSGLERTITASGLDPATLAVAVLGLVAIVIGVLTAATIGGPVATAGAVIVAAGVCFALGLLVR